MSNSIQISLNPSLQRILEDTLLDAQKLLGAFALDIEFTSKVKLTFGNDVDIAKAESLVQELANSDSPLLLTIEIRPASDINGANGAFAGDNYTIYLAQEVVEQNAENIPAITAILVEELGHALDFHLNRTDTSGDEGELLSNLVRGFDLSEGELERIKTENDIAIVVIDGQTVEIEQAGTVFSQVFNPVGIVTDVHGNVIVDNGAAIGLFDSDGNLIRQNFSTGLGYLAIVPSSGNILKLNELGELYQVNPSTLNSSPILNIKFLNNININSIFDIVTEKLSNFGGLVLPNAAQTQYGDISVLERGNQIDLFISAVSVVTPFVMRLRFQNSISSQSLIDARVVAASTGTTAGSNNLTRGVAVNHQGTVLTTLPIAVGSIFPTFIDVPVSFSADFPEGNGAIPQVRLEGQGANYSDGSNFVDIRSRGITTDNQGNFYVVTNSNPGSAALFLAPGLVILPSTVDRVIEAQAEGGFLGEFRDVAVNPSRTVAYITSSRNSILAATLNPVTPSDTPGNLLNDPIFRFQNGNLPGTFLFAGERESESIRQNFSPPFIEEGKAFNVSLEENDELIRFNRFSNNQVQGTYLYATEAESVSIRENFSDVFTEEGIAFYSYGADANKGVDVIRFRNKNVAGTYVFVLEEEANSIRQNFSNVFEEEGVAFEVAV